MFERFTQEARATVVQAQAEARRLRSDRIGTEHLLLALLDRRTPTAAVLERNGLDRQTVTRAVTDLEAGGLDALGIDLDAVRERVEAAFGPGALDQPSPSTTSGHRPFDRRAKKVLELSLRETIAMKQRTITDGHIALGLIREGEGTAMRVLTSCGIDGERLAGEIRVALLS